MIKLKAFIDDCKYYDTKKIELNTILKKVQTKNKTVLDIGAGTGRLSFPLSKYAKEVIALDKSKIFASYFKKHKKKNVIFINKDAKQYLKGKRKFDIILLAWPIIDFGFINLVRKSMHKNSRFILITCDDNSDFGKVIDHIEAGRSFEKDIKNKKKFISLLPKKFKLIYKRRIKTDYRFPDEKIAFRILKNSMKLWFKTKFNAEKDKRLREIIKDHKKENKIIFGE